MTSYSKRIAKSLLAVSFLLIHSFACAADWRELRVAPDGSARMFFDEASFRRVNHEVLYWLKVVYTKPRPLHVNDSGISFDGVVYFVSMDCKNRLVKFSDMNFYLNSKKVHSEMGAKAGYKNIQPDSSPELDFKKFCK